MATTITTSRAPISKPEARSVQLTTTYQTLIEPPNYDVPVPGAGQVGRAIVPGVAEIGSPLIVTNKTGVSQTVDVRIVRTNGDTSIIILGAVVEPNDSLYLALNGQFLLNTTGTLNGTGDKLEVRAGANSALDVTISYVVGQAEQNDVPTP